MHAQQQHWTFTRGTTRDVLVHDNGPPDTRSTYSPATYCSVHVSLCDDEQLLLDNIPWDRLGPYWSGLFKRSAHYAQGQSTRIDFYRWYHSQNLCENVYSHDRRTVALISYPKGDGLSCFGVQLGREFVWLEITEWSLNHTKTAFKRASHCSSVQKGLLLQLLCRAQAQLNMQEYRC